MQSYAFPTDPTVSFKPRDLELISDALMVRVKTFRASIYNAKKKRPQDLNFIEQLERDETETFWLLMHFADIQWIDRQVVETQLEKNPWLKRAMETLPL